MWKRDRIERVDLEDVLKPGLAAAPAAPIRTIEPAAPPVPAPAVAVITPPVAQKASVLGATLRFKGELIADEDLVVEGQVDGSILHTRSLTIGGPGHVRGDIRARRVIIEGKVNGNVYALESVVLRAGAVLVGDVFARRVAIETSARISGRVDMDNAPAVPKIDSLGLGSTDAAAHELSDREVGELLSGSSATAG
jgi:cytoskeletal protein CcmA (bactofilin family)